MKGINKQIEDLKKSLDELHARLAVSDKAMENLRDLYSIIWIEASYDPYNEKSRECAQKCLPYIKDLNKEFRFKK